MIDEYTLEARNRLHEANLYGDMPLSIRYYFATKIIDSQITELENIKDFFDECEYVFFDNRINYLKSVKLEIEKIVK